MEDIMQEWTLNELFRLTRAELFGLHTAIVADLANAPEASPEREVGLANLRKIAKVLALPNMAPG
jgi:hypothetical protein